MRVGRWGEAGEKNKRNWGRDKGRNEMDVFWICTTHSVLLALIVQWVGDKHVFVVDRRRVE